MARNPSFSRLFRPRRLALALATCFASTVVLALPTGGQVASGVATFNQSGNTLTVTNSSGSIINWQGFSIGNGETTRFIQPSATSSVLNRVIGSDPSLILGQLQSNGQVFLINPAGILVGAGARIDVAGFVASSLQMSDADFLSRRFAFQDTPGAGSVRNEGAISTPAGGSVYLVAPQVENAGLINTPKGETILAAGRSVEIVDTATPGVRVEITGSNTQATNIGSVMAESGRIGMVGALVRNAGTLSASSAVTRGGRIFLRAGSAVEQDASGRTEASGSSGGQISLQSGDSTVVEGKLEATGSAGRGGVVEVLGDKAGLFGAARVDASGAQGGGTVLVGGDYQGGNPDVQNAKVAYMSPEAHIRADATQDGHGGKVIIWADDTTRAYGSISARGGAQGGDGGFVETSGKRYLDVGNIAVDRSAPAGKAGTWLLDPDDITIYNSVDTPSGGSYVAYPPGLAFEGATGNPSLNWGVISGNLASGPVIIATWMGASGGSGNITFANGGNFNYNSDHELWFVAKSNIYGSNMFLTNGGIGTMKFIAGWNGSSLPADPWDPANYGVTPGTGLITFDSSTVTTYGSIYLKAGSDVVVRNVNYSGNTAGQVQAGENVSIDTWGSLRVQNMPAMPVAGSIARIESAGDMQINLHGSTSSILLQTDSGYGGGPAVVRSGGKQEIDFTAASGTHYISLTGGGAATPSGSRAALESQGDQYITRSGGAALDITLNGGSATSTDKDAWDGPSGTGTLICTSCATENGAEIRTAGQQHIEASNITLTGGSAGVRNTAEIGAQGCQDVIVSGNIQITGGAGGGDFVALPGIRGRMGNDAGIHSESWQTVSVGGNLNLTGGGASSGVAGAFLTSPYQNISVGGDLTLQGGNSNTTTFAGVGSGAVIGYDAMADTDISVAGALSMTAGGGSEGNVYIGTILDASGVRITASNISLSGSAQARAGIGALNGVSPATIDLTATGASGISLGSNSELLGNAGGWISLSAPSAASSLVNQSATGTRMIADSLMVSGNGSITLNGPDNQINWLSLDTGSGDIAYTSNAPSVSVSQATTPGNITLQTKPGAASEQSIGLDQVVGNNVSVTARNAIFDDNGDGVVNITANNISLTTVQDGNPWGIAISADIDSSGTVSATVPVASGPGGIRIHSLGASAPSSLNLSDATLGGTGDIFFMHEGDVNADSNYSIHSASGSAIVGASGDFTLAGGSISAPNGIMLNAGGTLAINSNLVQAGSIQLGGGGAVEVNATVENSSAGGDVSIYAPTVNVGGAGNVYSDYVFASANTLTVDGQLEAGQSMFVGADQLVVNGGTLSVTGGDLTADIMGDLWMTGGSLTASGNIFLGFEGADSMLYLNETSGPPRASIISGAAGLIQIDFLGRSEGGVVIDGLPGMATVPGSSGFYNGATPASLGGGLWITYGGIPLDGTLNSDLLGAVSSVDSSYSGVSPDGADTSAMPTDVFVDAGSASGGTSSAASGTGSAEGQTSGEFGETASGNQAESNGNEKDDEKKDRNKHRRNVCR